MSAYRGSMRLRGKDHGMNGQVANVKKNEVSNEWDVNEGVSNY